MGAITSELQKKEKECPPLCYSNMELTNHSDCCNSHMADKDLVNMFGGIAYDHDSMPKVIAVHTLTHERLNSFVNQGEGPQFNTMDGMSRKWYSISIGIRSNPQRLGELGSTRSYIDLKEHLESVTRTMALSSLGLEQLSQGAPQSQNTITPSPATAEVFEKRSPYKRTLKEDNSDSAISSSLDKGNLVNGPAFTSQIRHLLLTGEVNKNEDNYKRSATIGEEFPVAEKLSSPVEFNANTITFSELRKKESDNVENLDWRNVGVLIENSDQRNSYEVDTNKNSKASVGGEYHQRQANESCNVDSTQSSSIKRLNIPVGKDFGSDGHQELDKRDQKGCRGTAKSSLEMNPEGCDAKKRKTDCLIPRKRPRKSIPRKLDLNKRYLHSNSPGTDSEETLSADEITAELSPQQSVPVASPVSQDTCTPVISSGNLDQCKVVVSPRREEHGIPVVSTKREDQCALFIEKEEQRLPVVSCEREEQRSTVVSAGKEGECAAVVSPCSNVSRESALEVCPDGKVQCTPVVCPDREDQSATEVFPSNNGSDAVSSRGTKVVFKRTGGVWSVSSLNSSVKEGNVGEGTCSAGEELGQSQKASDRVQHFNEFYREKQAKKICVFTDRPIASLSDINEPCFSPALDREARIKELLGRQEKLLAQMRQKTVAS